MEKSNNVKGQLNTSLSILRPASPELSRTAKDESDRENKRNPLKEFWSSILWTIKINFKIMPFITAGRVIITILNQLDPLFSALFYAKLIDDLVNLQQQGLLTSAPFQKDIITVAAFFVGYKIIAFLVANFGFYFDRLVDFEWPVQINNLLAAKIDTLNISDIENPGFSDLLYRAKESLNDLKQQTVMVITVIAMAIRITITAFTLVKIVPLAVVIFLIIAIPRFLTQSRMLAEEWAFLRDVTERRRKATDFIIALFNSNYLPEIKLNGSFNFLREKYYTFAKWLSDEIKKRTNSRYTVSYLFTTINYLVIGYCIYQIGINFIDKQITLGQLTFYLSMSFTYNEAVSYILNMISGVYESNMKFEDLRKVLDLKTSLVEGEREFPDGDRIPEIEYQNISFKYPNSDKLVIKDLNLKIKSGEKIAIVGHNGAGKTTLIKTLLRLYELESGKILVDGVDLKEYKVRSWFKQVGVLFQEYMNYFFLNVAEGVHVGDLGKTYKEDEIIKALDEADALDFVNQFPDKLNQSLNEKYKGGTKPSTGQWQKLAIARFMYRDAKIVIFDEPTASIDAVSEAKIFNNIFEKLKDKTVIIISHRFSTVRKADRIIVLDGGKIVESGTHADLLKLNGVYASSYKLQAEGYKDEAE